MPIHTLLPRRLLSVLALALVPLGAQEAGPAPTVLTQEDIRNCGARTLAELLEDVPGVRLARDRSRTLPATGPVVSTQSDTQLGAGQFSRVLILFKGHRLNKVWNGGADQDWETGFLEGLREVRVHLGPAAGLGGALEGAVDLVVELVPYDGRELKGDLLTSLGISRSAERWDKEVFHVHGGDQWGADGQVAWFLDGARWNGADVVSSGLDFQPGDRLDRKAPSYQGGLMLQRAGWELTARHLEHETVDPRNCGRRWAYTFMEGSRAFELRDHWTLRTILAWDRIGSRWGLASSRTWEHQGDWDQTVERRIAGRVEVARATASATYQATLEARTNRITGGPDSGPATLSVMNVDGRRTDLASGVRGLWRLEGAWSLEASLQGRRESGAPRTTLLPTLGVSWEQKGSAWGLRLATASRPVDAWFSLGSSLGTPDGGRIAYVVPNAVEAEQSRQLRLWFRSDLKEGWSASGALFTTTVSHLHGYDWDFAQSHGFLQVRVMDTGSIRSTGAFGDLRVRRGNLSAFASLTWQRTSPSDTALIQRYINPSGEALYLPALSTALGLDWKPTPRVVASLRIRAAGPAPNGGLDLGADGILPRFDQGDFRNGEAQRSLTLSLRMLELRPGLELQLLARNATGATPRLPLVEGGTWQARGRELGGVVRWRFR